MIKIFTSLFLILLIFSSLVFGQNTESVQSVFDDPMVKSLMSMSGIDLSQPLGVTIAVVIANIIFGLIGFFAFIRGKKQGDPRKMIIGIILMVYPFFTSNIWLVYIIGIASTAILYLWRE